MSNKFEFPEKRPKENAEELSVSEQRARARREFIEFKDHPPVDPPKAHQETAESILTEIIDKKARRGGVIKKERSEGKE